MPSTRKTTKNPVPQSQPATAMFEPASAPVDPAATSVVPVTVPAVIEPASAPAVVVEPSAAPERLRFGQVEGLLHRLPLGAVLVHLEPFEDRIAMLQNSQAVLDLQSQMRATEGRCAPIYFTAESFTSPWNIISGIESVAAAISLGMDCVFVVTVRPGTRGRSSHTQLRQRPSSPLKPRTIS